MTNGHENRILIDLYDIHRNLAKRIESAHGIAARGKLGTARCCVSTLATALSLFWNP